jgi:hypothetical protein
MIPSSNTPTSLLKDSGPTSKPADFPDDEVEVEEAGQAKDGDTFEKSFILDYNRSNLHSIHVILQFNKLINFIDANFVCQQCGGSKSTY